MARGSFSRIAFITWPKGEWMTRWMNRKLMTKIPATSQYRSKSRAMDTLPRKAPRGIAWMPSSPLVKGAWTQKKYTICAIASVIMAK